MNEPQTAVPGEVRSAPEAEAKRVAAVEALDLFGESTELAYDDAVHLASIICSTPISLISVLDATTQRFKAKIGLDPPSMAKEHSFCVHAIQQPAVFIVTDAMVDQRFKDLPFVREQPFIRFYAGVPLWTIQGEAVGTLCVCDYVPRELNTDQKTALTILSRQVAARFNDREKIVRMAEIIAEKERIERELQSSHALFNTFMDNSPLLSYVKDQEGRLVYYNRAFMETFKVGREDWLGKDERDFFPREDASRLVDIDRQVFLKDQLSVMETSVPGVDGEQHVWKSYKFNFRNASGDRFLVAMCHEITGERKALQEVERYHTELRRANERLRELSLTDPLTGCWNRRAFDERLAREAAACERHAGVLAVLMIDIDNFKRINDTFGHDIGDQVLCHVAGILKAGARGTDFVCRYGGEEFAILLPRTSTEGAIIIAERLRLAVNERWDGQRVTVSVGIAGRSIAFEDCTSLVRCADEALYRAKAGGRNRVEMALKAA